MHAKIKQFLTGISSLIADLPAVLEHEVQPQREGHGDDEEGEDEAEDDGDAGPDGHVQGPDGGVQAEELQQLGDDHHHADA